MCSGAPRTANRCCSANITSRAVNVLPASIARHSRAYSSITTTFPIREGTVEEPTGDRVYNLVIKGNTAVFINPAGKNWPLHQRVHYREDHVRWPRERASSPKTTSGGEGHAMGEMYPYSTHRLYLGLGWGTSG